jgi:DNA-binding response OmpR family regulator
MEPPDTNTTAASILIVDDTPANLKLLSGMLKERGYSPRTVSSGERALEAAQLMLPDLILLDVAMPVMDGFEVCTQLKADPDLKNIPIIFISALTDATVKVKAFTVGGDDYITKPFRFEEVEARVRTQLELRRQHRELLANNERLRRSESTRDYIAHMVIRDMHSHLMNVMQPLTLAINSEEGRIGHMEEAQRAASKLNELMLVFVDATHVESNKSLANTNAAKSDRSPRAK